MADKQAFLKVSIYIGMKRIESLHHCTGGRVGHDQVCSVVRSRGLQWGERAGNRSRCIEGDTEQHFPCRRRVFIQVKVKETKLLLPVL